MAEGKHGTVLIVDDTAENIRTLTDILRDDYAILAATSGHRALERVEKHLGSNSFFRYARQIAFSHHERRDGTGHRLGLAGADIPPAGRIMALAGVYDVLTSARAYKAAMPHHEAAALIRQGRGAHFDPELVDAFAQLEEAFREICETYADEETGAWS